MRPIKRAIILCWIMLVACFAIKLFGGNWFEVVCTNEHFLKLCDFVENNIFLYNLISYFVYLIPQTIIILSISNNPRPSKIYCLIVSLVLSIIWAIYFISPTTKSILEFVFMALSPVFCNFYKNDINKKLFLKSIARGILGLLLVTSFQLISFFTRNLEINIYNNSILVTSIMLLDYYIMICLFYLYVKINKGRGKE
jgi:hypothetical protein